ncbi:MAG: hypothetical protein QM688_02145 [Sphingomonas bacterium]
MARAGLRGGTLTLGDALGVRPPHMGLGYAGFEDLIVSRLVGGMRRLRQTFAA